MKKYTTKNAEETKRLAKEFASSFCGGEILCLNGNLGSGKTTFTQAILETLGAEKPYTSPTFVIMKNYKGTTKNKASVSKSLDIHHIDTYRVGRDDIIDLGWHDFAGKNDSITIIEWAEKIKDIAPQNATWISFKWVDENIREITIT